MLLSQIALHELKLRFHLIKEKIYRSNWKL